MKGHMQDGKFHPHTEYKKGTRMSRDQQAKTQGVRLRKQRTQQLEVISKLTDYTPKQLEDLMRKKANTTDFGESMGKEGDQHVMDGKHFISTEGEIFGNGKLFHNNYVDNALRDEQGNVHWNGNMEGWILSSGMVRVRADVKNDFLELELPEKLTPSQIKTIREHIEVHNLGRDEISIDDRSKDYSVTKQLGLRFKRENLNKFYDDIMLESARMRGDLYDPITKTYSEPSKNLNPSLAHCGGTSCAINRMFGKGSDMILVRGNILNNGVYEDHAWNRNKQGDIIDASRDQFGDTIGIHIIKPTDKRYHSYTEYEPTNITLPQELRIQNQKRMDKRAIRGFAEIIIKEDTLGGIEAGMMGLRS